MKKVVLVCIIVTILINCTNKGNSKYFNNYYSFKNFPNNSKGNFENFNQSKFLMLPNDIKVINNKYIVVLTNKNNELIQIYDIHDGKLLKSFGSKGQGPGEFIFCRNILFSNKQPNKFYIFDVSKQTQNLYDINNILKNNVVLPDTIIKISRDSGISTQMCVLDNKNFVSIGFQGNRVCLFNELGDTISSNYYIPGKIDEKIVNFIHLQAYEGLMSKNDFHQKILVCTFNQDIIEIYDYLGNIVKTMHGPDQFLIDYSKEEQFSERSLNYKRERHGYFSICSNSENIFAAYSGIKIDNIYDWPKKLGRKLLIFDWEGEPVRKVTLNTAVSYMDYCKNNNTIYALCYDGEDFFIGYYKINEQ